MRYQRHRRGGKVANAISSVPYSLYRPIDELQNDEQQSIAAAIRTAVGETLSGSNVVCVLGFGSFWQRYGVLRDGSDIDFFVLVSREPSASTIRAFGDALRRFNARWPWSPHLFVGTVEDVANGPENIIRCLTIHERELAAPVLLLGHINGTLLNFVQTSRLHEWFSHALFSITRSFNFQQIADSLTGSDDRPPVTHQKFVQRFIQAALIAEQLCGTRLLHQRLGDQYLGKSLTRQEICSCLQDLYDDLKSHAHDGN